MIRHPGMVSPAIPVLALPITVVLPAFGALLVATVRKTSLPSAGLRSTGHRAITLTTITVGTDPEYRLTPAARPLPKYHLAMVGHPRRRRGLDNDDHSWQGRTILWLVGYLMKVANQGLTVASGEPS